MKLKERIEDKIGSYSSCTHSKRKEAAVNIIKITAALFILSLFLCVIMMVLTVMPSDFNLIKILVFDIRILFLNMWPILAVMALLYFVSNRMWVSFSFTSLVFFAVAEINRFKMYFRDDPFVFKDILLFSEAKEMINSYALFLDKATLCALLLIIALAVLCFFFSKNKVGNVWVRIGGAILFCILLPLSCNSFYFNNRGIYNSLWHEEFGNPYKESNKYMSRGVVYSFLNSVPLAYSIPPEGYDEEAAKEILSSYKDADMPEDKKVNIISIMLEGYNDFSKFEGVETGSVDPYKNMHLMQRDGFSGKLYTNVFAGDTIKTERSFLTGYGGSDFSRNIDTHISYFKSQGYYTEAMHPSYGWFYNRRNINEFMGFDSFLCYENKYGEIPDSKLREEKYYGMISDADFFDYIMADYEKALKEHKNYFNFSVTYQNHGPYSNEDIADTQYAVKKEHYTDKEYNIFNNYLTGIFRTDRAIGTLREFADKREEPLVLILFGDHNPLLGEGNSVYEMLGINLDFTEVDGAANYYQTPYVIYANDAAKKALERDFKGTGETISPMFLMNEFFEYCGLEGSAYLNYLSDVKKEYSVINSVYLKSGDEYILRKNAEDDDTLLKRQWVEYYMLRRK